MVDNKKLSQYKQTNADKEKDAITIEKENCMELDKLSYYHITPTKNVEGIKKEKGLMTQTGENSKLDNDTRKSVYFVQGMDSVYKLITRFIKSIEAEMLPDDEKREFGSKKQEKIRHDIAENKQELEKIVEEYSKQGGVFEKFANMLKSSTYFQLDLVEGIDYTKTDDERFTRSNMYTDNDIPIQKMNKIILDNKEDTNAYDFVKYIYANFRDELWDKESDFGNSDRKYYLELLDNFMEKELEKEEAGKKLETQPMERAENKEPKNILKDATIALSEGITEQDIVQMVLDVSKNREKVENKSIEESNLSEEK